LVTTKSSGGEDLKGKKFGRKSHGSADQAAAVTVAGKIRHQRKRDYLCASRQFPGRLAEIRTNALQATLLQSAGNLKARDRLRALLDFTKAWTSNAAKRRRGHARYTRKSRIRFAVSCRLRRR